MCLNVPAEYRQSSDQPLGLGLWTANTQMLEKKSILSALCNISRDVFNFEILPHFLLNSN